MHDDIAKKICSGIKSLDKLRFKAAGSRSGCITVSIEDLNAIRDEVEKEITGICKCGEELYIETGNGKVFIACH